jgi:NitT/TauT family transport system substrate-binding protein
MRKKWIAVAAVCAICLAGLTAFIVVRSDREPPVDVTLYLGRYVSTGFARIAAAEGYFADEGLNVTIKDFDQGNTAVAEFVKDPGIAFSDGSEIVATDVHRTDKDLRIIAQSTSDDDYFDFVIASDTGQATLDSLVGMRIGLPPMSATRVFALKSLSDHGLQQGRDYTVVEIALKDMAAAMKSGTIDAHASREPYSSASVDALGGRAAIVRDPGAYVLLDSVIASKRTMGVHPDVAPALLRAYLRAQDLLVQDPQRARELIAKGLGATIDTVQQSDTDLMDLRLGDQLLEGLDNARTYLSQDQGYPPSDYFGSAEDMVDTAPLASVDPSRVTIG